MIRNYLKRNVVIICFVVALGGAFSLRSLKLSRKCVLESSNMETDDEGKFDSFNHFLKQVSCDLSQLWYLISSLFGFILGWPLANRIGRKSAVMTNVIFRLIAVFLFLLQNIMDRQITGILLAGNLVEGMYHGLLQSLNLLYIYEISPKLPASVGSLPALTVITFYLLLMHMVSYLSSAISTAILFATNLGNYIILLLSLISGLVQLAVLMKFYPESPGYLVIYQSDIVEAKQALQKLRENENVSEELEEIQKEKCQHDLMKQSTYTVMLFVIGILFQAVLVQIGMLQWSHFGISPWTIQGIYFGYIVIALLSALCTYLKVSYPISKIKEHMFSSYLICSVLYTLGSILLLLTLNYPNVIFEVMLIVTSGVSTIVMSSFPAVVTTVLILDYPSLVRRARNMVLSVIFGGILAFLIVFLFVLVMITVSILTHGLPYYILTILPGLVFCCIVCTVWVIDRHVDTVNECK